MSSGSSEAERYICGKLWVRNVLSGSFATPSCWIGDVGDGVALQELDQTPGQRRERVGA